MVGRSREPELRLNLLGSVVNPNTLNFDLDLESGSRILAQFGSGSGSRVILSILKEKIQNNFIEK